MRSVSKKYDLKISIFSVYYIDIDPKGHWSLAADSRNLLNRYGVNINDAANGVPLGHPRPHNITHTKDFHKMVNTRLHTLVNRMKDAGYGRKAIRSAIRRELRKIGKEVI